MLSVWGAKRHCRSALMLASSSRRSLVVSTILMSVTRPVLGVNRKLKTSVAPDGVHSRIERRDWGYGPNQVSPKTSDQRRLFAAHVKPDWDIHLFEGVWLHLPLVECLDTSLI